MNASIIRSRHMDALRRHGMHALLSRLVLLLASAIASLFITVTCHAVTDEDGASEYAVKAAFLFKFAGFVDWAPGTFKSANSPIVIGIVGDDPFGPVIDKLVLNHMINGHPITILRGHKIGEISGEQILFIGSSESSRMAPIAANLAGKHVLTVADFQDPIVIINFVIESEKVRFDVNLEQARQVGIKLSSKLLSVAKEVYGK
jgi:hypothetical protein